VGFAESIKLDFMLSGMLEWNWK